MRGISVMNRELVTIQRADDTPLRGLGRAACNVVGAGACRRCERVARGSPLGGRPARSAFVSSPLRHLPVANATVPPPSLSPCGDISPRWGESCPRQREARERFTLHLKMPDNKNLPNRLIWEAFHMIIHRITRSWAARRANIRSLRK